MEGVLCRPNISNGIYFGANNMMFLCNDHRLYYCNVNDFQPKCHRKYSMPMAVSKKDGIVVLEKGKNRVDDEKKRNKKMIKKQKMMIKERGKLLKGLSMEFTGLLMDSHKIQLQEVSEALQSELKELKSEYKELKKKMKEENSRAASTCSSSSSSSSSESSDSECEKEVLDMNRLKHETNAQPPSSLTINEEVFHPQLPLIMQENAAPISAVENCTMPKSDEDRNNSLLSLLEGKKAEENNNNSKKIEVCMGGKCRKSGSGELLEEFRRVVGETAPHVDVIGCKCMGKCRDGPNVRLVSTPQAPPIDDVNVGFTDNELHHHHRQVNIASDVAVTDTNTLSLQARRSLKKAQRSSLPLCIGVGLEDVGFIVSKLTGEPIFVQEQCIN